MLGGGAERIRVVPTGIHILGERVVVARLAQGDLLVPGLVLGEDVERTKGVPGVHHVLEELHLVLLDWLRVCTWRMKRNETHHNR